MHPTCLRQYILTSGSAYVDIDVLACACAYQQLLSLRGISSKAVLKAPLNETIPISVQQWNLDYSKDYTPTDNDSFVIVDVSNPEYFETFVKENNVVEIFDHHHGFEKYWSNRLGEKSHIDFIGSCATLIWEQYVEYSLENKISKTNANLLVTAIIANTLCLKSNLTNKRDIQALEQLKQYCDLPNDWKNRYYSEIESSMLADISNAISKDTKSLMIGSEIFKIAQIEIWDADAITSDAIVTTAKKAIGVEDGEHWLLNIANISQGNNILITDNEKTRSLLYRIGYPCHGRIWLRKEIIKTLSQKVRLD